MMPYDRDPDFRARSQELIDRLVAAQVDAHWRVLRFLTIGATVIAVATAIAAWALWPW